MTKFEYEQVYLRCFMCCTPLPPQDDRLSRIRACKGCWAQHGRWAADKGMYMICRPILWQEWGQGD